MTQEILPPEGRRILDPDRELTYLDLPEYADWTREELDHAHWFQDQFRTGARYFVHCGEILTRARHALPHGRFLRWIDECLPIGVRTAQKFMRIAGDENIRAALRLAAPNATRESSLPPIPLPADREILTELCGLETQAFRGMVASGVIHPEMKRGDVKRHRVAIEHQAAGPAPDLPAGEHGAIVADPPWPFETWSDAGKDRAPENHYPTMTIAEIKALPVVESAAKDAVLFLWVTPHVLPQAPEIIQAWGFEYKTTAFIWCKESPGLGYWTRKESEICLLGVRGKPKRQAADVPDVIRAPRTGHSRKPDEAFWRIERLVSGPYLELFAREPRLGWNRWGYDPALREAAD